MGVNLYDSPAQAQFINTYVPIQFEGLYKMADKAQSDMDKGTELVDNLSAMSSLGSLSKVDNANWTADYGDVISNFINEKVKSNYDLTNPEVLSGLASIKRKIQNDPNAKNMLESKENLKQAAAKVDPKWGSTYTDIFNSYDTKNTGQIYSGNTMEYRGWEGAGDAYTKEIKARKLRKEGGYFVMGVDPTDVKHVVNDKANEISSDPELNLLVDKDMKDGKINPNSTPSLFKKDPATKQPVLIQNWRGEYAKTMVANAKMDATIGNTLMYDQAGADANRMAEQRLYHNQILGLKQKEVENAKVIQNWLNGKQEDVASFKTTHVENKTALHLAKYTDPNARFNVAKNMLGSAESATYIVTKMDRDAIKEKIDKLTSDKSVAQAAGKPVDDYTSQISNLTSEYDKKNVILRSTSNAFRQSVSNEEAKAMRGKGESIYFNRQQLNELNLVDTPAVVGTEFAKIVFGPSSKMVFAAGPNAEGIIGSNTKLKIRSAANENDENLAIRDEVSRVQKSDRPKAELGLRTFTAKLKSGAYDNKGFTIPGGQTKIEGQNSELTGVYYIPKDELSQEEQNALVGLYGTEIFSTKDKEVDPKTYLNVSVKKEFVKVPIFMPGTGASTEMENTVYNQNLMHKFGKDNYQTKKETSVTASETNSASEADAYTTDDN